eukprot:1161358-Pelagomonas_calceolata.AAC.3
MSWGLHLRILQADVIKCTHHKRRRAALHKKNGPHDGQHHVACTSGSCRLTSHGMLYWAKKWFFRPLAACSVVKDTKPLVACCSVQKVRPWDHIILQGQQPHFLQTALTMRDTASAAATNWSSLSFVQPDTRAPSTMPAHSSIVITDQAKLKGARLRTRQRPGTDFQPNPIHNSDTMFKSRSPKFRTCIMASGQAHLGRALMSGRDILSCVGKFMLLPEADKTPVSPELSCDMLHLVFTSQI